MRENVFGRFSAYKFNTPRTEKSLIALFLGVILILCAAGAARAATFTVTKIADTNDGVCDADCSLREAVTAAAAVPSDDVINFSAAVFSTAQTITLGGGELSLSNGALTINGTGANLLTISGNNASRVFFVAQNTNAVLNNLKITGGNGAGQTYNGNGGAIAVAGGSTSLTLNNAIITANRTSNRGGGIYSNAGLTVNNTTISSNTAASGGGIFQFAAGIVNVNNATVSSNQAFFDGGGFAIERNNTVTLTDSLFDRNRSLNGGAIFTNSSVNLVRTRLNGNSATGDAGGGIYAANNESGGGSAIVVTVTDSVLSGNTAPRGGGGYLNTGAETNLRPVVVNVINSTVSDNQATDTDGGGFYLFHGTLNATNTTFSGNFAARYGGALSNSNVDTPINLTSATVSHNSAAAAGGGILTNFNNLTVSDITLRNTIVSDNSATNGPDIVGAINSQGYLLIGNTFGTTILGSQTGLILNVSPRLGPLVNNGGATPTRALLAGSPAIDTGDPNNAFATDQRGTTRPKDGNGDGIALSDIGAFEFDANAVVTRARFDFDGDGKSDVSVFRPSNGYWYTSPNSANNYGGVLFGQSGDKLVPADYDGDGKTDVAVFRNGAWYLQRSNAGFTGISFGDGNDIPVPGDYDGDGKSDLAVFRPSNGYWYILNLTNNQFTATLFGISTDRPVPADYDGDGKTDLAVNRAGNWYLQRSQAGLTGIQFGDGTDKLVPADYDGDGKTDIAVFRPSNGYWYLLQSQAGFTGIAFGLGTDILVAADYDGDGKADLAVVRNGSWYLNRTTQGFTGISFGTSTDLPIPNAFVR